MAHAHARLTKHFGEDGKEPKKSHEFAREKALNFLGVMESTKDDIRTISKTHCVVHQIECGTFQ
jgi:hypothetical protein